MGHWGEKGQSTIECRNNFVYVQIQKSQELAKSHSRLHNFSIIILSNIFLNSYCRIQTESGEIDF